MTHKIEIQSDYTKQQLYNVIHLQHHAIENLRGEVLKLRRTIKRGRKIKADSFADYLYNLAGNLILCFYIISATLTLAS